MVPSGSTSRQVLIWSVPTLVILLSLVWYRRKRNTLRTDPGGTSDSATKAKADKETNGHVHPALSEPPSDEVKGPLPEKLPSVVEETVPQEVKKACVAEETVPQEVKKACVVEETVPQEVKKACVVEETVPQEVKKACVVEETVPQEVKEASVVEAVPNEVKEASAVQESAPKVAEKASVVQGAAPKEAEEPSVVQEAASKEANVLPEAVTKEVKKPGVEQEAVAKEAKKASVAVSKESKRRSVVQEAVPTASVVKEAVPKEAKKAGGVKKAGVVQEAAPKKSKKPSSVVEEPVLVKGAAKKVAKRSVVREAEKVEEPVCVKKVEESSRAMSEEDAASEGGAAAAAVLQEEKVGSLGGKLASLTLEEQRADADRDSANHSPVDAMLASPSLSNYSDEHSEGSSDSGKGCSDVASPPSRTPLGGSSLAGDAEADADPTDVRYAVYEFLLPHFLVGRLIGPRGSFVQEIKSKTNATVQVKKHPETNKQKICVVDGTQSEVDAALVMIRERFPLRKNPAVTLEQVFILSNVQPTCALIPEYCQLHLVEGVNNEVMVSCMVSPGHMFLQQPYHPTFQYLTRLSEAMNSVYSHADAPHVPEPITVGSICVAPATEGWYRVQVVSLDDENHSCEVKFVDHGGYMTISNSSLRQIHHDFMSVPFQATECYLASIKPAGGSNVWSDEAVRLVDELTRGQMLYAQVYDYTEYSIPLVYLYCCINSLVVLINQELVARGLAELDEVASAESVAAEAAALVAAAAEVAPLTRQPTENPSEVGAV